MRTTYWQWVRPSLQQRQRRRQTQCATLEGHFTLFFNLPPPILVVIVFLFFFCSVLDMRITYAGLIRQCTNVSPPIRMPRGTPLSAGLFQLRDLGFFFSIFVLSSEYSSQPKQRNTTRIVSEHVQYTQHRNARKGSVLSAAQRGHAH